nr:MAG TPA: hypothetical protein [Caudoviricetes sp.]
MRFQLFQVCLKFFLKKVLTLSVRADILYSQASDTRLAKSSPTEGKRRDER